MGTLKALLRQEKNSVGDWCIYFLQGKQASHEQNISHLKNLKDMGVDTTAYMVGLTPRPQKVIKVITQGQGANFHLHRNWGLSNGATLDNFFLRDELITSRTYSLRALHGGRFVLAIFTHIIQGYITGTRAIIWLP